MPFASTWARPDGRHRHRPPTSQRERRRGRRPVATIRWASLHEAWTLADAIRNWSADPRLLSAMLATCPACARSDPDPPIPANLTDVLVGRSPRRGRDILAEAGLLEHPELSLFLQ